jgi:hypothetical protein
MAVVAEQNGAAEAAPQVPVGTNGQTPSGQTQQSTSASNDQIGGMSTMRGLIVYGAVFAFAGLFIDFMVVISTSRVGVKPSINATLISAAAALSGVLGSAFALKIGVTPSPAAVNQSLADHLSDTSRSKTAARIRQALSLEPSSTTDKSWPLTFGIWVYGIVASATVAVYILNQNETPNAVKALAVTFGGYVLALLNMAYGLTKAGN